LLLLFFVPAKVVVADFAIRSPLVRLPIVFSELESNTRSSLARIMQPSSMTAAVINATISGTTAVAVPSSTSSNVYGVAMRCSLYPYHLEDPSMQWTTSIFRVDDAVFPHGSRIICIRQSFNLPPAQNAIEPIGGDSRRFDSDDDDGEGCVSFGLDEDEELPPWRRMMQMTQSSFSTMTTTTNADTDDLPVLWNDQAQSRYGRTPKQMLVEYVSKHCASHPVPLPVYELSIVNDGFMVTVVLNMLTPRQRYSCKIKKEAGHRLSLSLSLSHRLSSFLHRFNALSS
jgi:hypothetical protein